MSATAIWIMSAVIVVTLAYWLATVLLAFKEARAGPRRGRNCPVDRPLDPKKGARVAWRAPFFLPA